MTTRKITLSAAALLMVAALCVGTVAGCGSKDTESSKSESSKNENSESSTGDSKDDLSPITFKYYNADGKNGNWENPVAQAIGYRCIRHFQFRISGFRRHDPYQRCRRIYL